MDQVFFDVAIGADIFIVSPDRTALQLRDDPSKQIPFSAMERLALKDPLVTRRFLYDPEKQGIYRPKPIPPTLPSRIMYVHIPDLFFLSPELAARAMKKDLDQMLPDFRRGTGRALLVADEIPRTMIDGKQYHIDTHKMEVRRVNDPKDTYPIKEVFTIKDELIIKLINISKPPPPRPPRKRDGDDPSRGPGGP